MAKQYVVVEVEGGVVTETTGFGCDPEFIVVDWDSIETDYDEAREKLNEINGAGHKQTEVMSKIIDRLKDIIAGEDEEEDGHELGMPDPE